MENRDLENEDNDYIEIKNYVHCDSLIINTLCVVGLIGALLALLTNKNLQDLVSGTHLGNLAISITDAVPGMVFNLMDAVGFCGLMYLLKGALSKFGKPMNGLIWSLIVFYALGALCSFSDSFGAQFFAIVASILMVVCGFKMKNNYKNDVRTLGLTFIFCPLGFILIIILFSIMAFCAGIPENSADAIDSVAEVACVLVLYLSLGRRVGCTLRFWS